MAERAGRADPPLFNAHAITDEGQAILTDSIPDALALIAAGLDWTCAITTSDLGAVVAALREREAAYLWLAHPSTPAGDGAARMLASLVRPHGMRCRRLRWPSGMNAQSYAQRFPSADALPAIVRAAERY